LLDSRGRSWQCGTIQLDFVLPERLDALYVNDRNERERPVMIHHAVLGSMERFIAMLLEHHEGWLPLWLAPEQVAVATINDASAAYALQVVLALADGVERLRIAGLAPASWRWPEWKSSRASQVLAKDHQVLSGNQISKPPMPVTGSNCSL
jgi:threonyl-tRNA synthetase